MIAGAIYWTLHEVKRSEVVRRYFAWVRQSRNKHQIQARSSLSCTPLHASRLPHLLPVEVDVAAERVSGAREGEKRQRNRCRYVNTHLVKQPVHTAERRGRGCLSYRLIVRSDAAAAVAAAAAVVVVATAGVGQLRATWDTTIKRRDKQFCAVSVAPARR